MLNNTEDPKIKNNIRHRMHRERRKAEGWRHVGWLVPAEVAERLRGARKRLMDRWKMQKGGI